MPVEKQPTFADLQKRGLKPEQIEEEGVAQDEAFKSNLMGSIRSWLLFWTGVTILAALIYSSDTIWVFRGNFHELGTLLEKFAMILFLVAAVLIYTSYVAGTTPLFPPMAYSSGTGAIETELHARARMFNNLLGPVIGIALGVTFILINQMN